MSSGGPRDAHFKGLWLPAGHTPLSCLQTLHNCVHLLLETRKVKVPGLTAETERGQEGSWTQFPYGGVLPTQQQAILEHQRDVLQLNSVLTLPGGSIRTDRLKVQFCKTAHAPEASLGCHLCFWLTNYESETPTTPPWV